MSDYENADTEYTTYSYIGKADGREYESDIKDALVIHSLSITQKNEIVKHIFQLDKTENKNIILKEELIIMSNIKVTFIQVIRFRLSEFFRRNKRRTEARTCTMQSI